MLIIIRGQSGAGKTTLARRLRESASAPTALIEQDYLRRIVLKEKDVPGGANIRLIEQTARFALENGYHLVLEGILYAPHYGEMLRALIDSTRCPVHVYYLDVPFEETLCRHATKPNAHEFGEREMRLWWKDDDVLGVPGEVRLPGDLSQDETVALILGETGLDQPAAT